MSNAAGKCVVQGQIGKGGVGTVHKGHDQELGRDVAMKFLHEREEFRKRLKDYQAAAR